MKLPKIEEMILESVQQEIEEETRPKRVHGVFRASELGDCPRALQYSFMGAGREPISPELALLFLDGHLHHHAVRGLLRRIGRVSNEESNAVKEYVYDDTGIKITGTCDGIFLGDYVFDVKSINFFGFNKLSEDTIESEHPGYVDQLQTYLDIFNKEQGFIIFKCKMTSRLKVFWFKRDPERLEKALRRLSVIMFALDQKKMIKRPYAKSSKDCKRCPYQKVCWAKD